MVYRDAPITFWLDLIRRPSTRARSAAILKLAFIWPGSDVVWSEVIPALVHVLRFDPVLDVRRDAAYGLMEIGSNAARAVPALIEAARDRDEVIRWYAVVALHHIGPPAGPALPVLIEALGEDNPRLRAWAADAIAALGPEAVIAPLEAAGWPPESWPEALGRAGASVRALVALALGTRGRDGAAAMADVLNDGHPMVRQAAAAALVSLGSESGRALELAVRHPDAAVRLFAALALGRLGPESERALRALMADPDPGVRYLAGWSLSRAWSPN